MAKWRKFLILFTLTIGNIVDQPAPEITIDQGTLQGKISSDGTFYEYLGIPYATVTKENRFQAPGPPPKWDGVYKAIDEHYSCVQKSQLMVSGIEDCLKINIYVPVKAEKPLSVMVFIHGGAFLMGSGGKLLYGPEFLLLHDIILVTFNYRLGALGFMCLGIKEAPGNAGLKDQVAALRWVKKNIAAFGGDPDNVTIFGESAGGTSTSIMIASNATDGLFKRAIVQSGSSIANWAINRRPIWTASLLAQVMGFHATEDPYELYDFFMNAPLSKLMGSKTKKPYDEFFETELIQLPCIEKTFPGVEPVITDLPYNLLHSVDRKNVSVIYGSNDNEGLFLIIEETEERLRLRNDGYMFASDLEFPSREIAQEVSKEVNKYYFGNDPIAMNKIMNVSDIYRDLYFEIPELMEADIVLENTKQPIYYYIFKYAGGRNLLKWLIGHNDKNGACHGDDLLYLFAARYWPIRPSKKDSDVINYMTKLWTNFAKYGDPTPIYSDLPVRWEPTTLEKKRILYIDSELSMGPLRDETAYNLWKEIYRKYRKRDWSY